MQLGTRTEQSRLRHPNCIQECLERPSEKLGCVRKSSCSNSHCTLLMHLQQKERHKGPQSRTMHVGGARECSRKGVFPLAMHQDHLVSIQDAGHRRQQPGHVDHVVADEHVSHMSRHPAHPPARAPNIPLCSSTLSHQAQLLYPFLVCIKITALYLHSAGHYQSCSVC